MEEMISIVVPVYGAAEYIAETIRMVRGQTYPCWELILVDDCSPDGSVPAIETALADLRHCSEQRDGGVVRQIEEYFCEEGQRIALLRKAKNEGAARARNTGTAEARGRYLAFLDADDIWMPDKLEKELQYMKEKQAGFVFTAYEFGDEKAAPTGKVVHVPETLCYRQALSRTVIFTTTVLFDREKIAAQLLQMPDVASEDTATWWQILRAGHVAYGLDQVLAIYRRLAKSLSSNKWQAIRRIWNLYRRQEGLSVLRSACCFVFWAVRATVRRL